jgi:HAD superfamily hydrolase (TIGR01549 family)
MSLRGPSARAPLRLDRRPLSVPQAVLLDVDGTLVDTNYHHALAWYRAFREHGIVLPVWRLHRHVGMGGDKFVAAVAGEQVEAQLGERLRERWEELFDEVIDEVEPLAGARELIEELKRQGRAVVLASSAIERHLDSFLEKLHARDVVDGWTTKDDVESSKPDPDLVNAGLERAGTRDAIMVGDTPWDCAAASRAGVATVTLMTGGFSDQELRDAGSIAVFESIESLLAQLGKTPLSAA